MVEFPSGDDRGALRQREHQSVCAPICFGCSLYTYIVKGLGPTVGVLSGWALLLGYTLTGMSTLCGFGIFGQMLLGELGIHVPIIALFVVGVVASYIIAHKDIQLSAKMMLVFEAVSLVAFSPWGSLCGRPRDSLLIGIKSILKALHQAGC